MLLILHSSVWGFTVAPLFHRTNCRPFLSPVASSNQEEVAVGGKELIVLDGDDEVGEERTYRDFYNQFRKLAADKKRRTTVGDEADGLFDEMFEAYVNSEDPALWPNTTIYNMVLDIHAWSPVKDGADKAEHILDRMEDLTVETIARPNGATYRHVMEAWANRNSPLKAKEVLERMKERYGLTANPELQPDTVAYNKLLAAWLKSDCAEQAEAVLQDMMQQAEQGNVSVLPNTKSFIQVMRCYANQQTSKSLDKVKQVFQDLQKLHRLTAKSQLQPDVYVYNELINAIAQNRDITENRGQQAEAILYEMMEAANMGNDALEPNAATFRHVIFAYRGNNEPGVAYKMEQLLQLSGDMANLPLYNAAIQVISFTREPEKAALTWKLVQQMCKKGLEPTMQTYNHVLNACGHSYDAKDPKEVFKLAVEAFNSVRDNADLTSYGHFLSACSKLLPENKKRDAVVKGIFLKCCKDGQVGRYVLAELMKAASDKLVAELLGGLPEDGVKIPRKWSRNVKDNRQLLR
jgi:hypothetical protein